MSDRRHIMNSDSWILTLSLSKYRALLAIRRKFVSNLFPEFLEKDSLIVFRNTSNLTFESFCFLLKSVLLITPTLNTKLDNNQEIGRFLYLEAASESDPLVEICLSASSFRTFASTDVIITVQNLARFISSCRTLGLQDTDIIREIQKLLFSHLPSNAPIFSDPRFTVFSPDPSFTGDDSIIYETINPPPALLNPKAFADPSETGIFNTIFGEPSPNNPISTHMDNCNRIPTPPPLPDPLLPRTTASSFLSSTPQRDQRSDAAIQREFNSTNPTPGNPTAFDNIPLDRLSRPASPPQVASHPSGTSIFRHPTDNTMAQVITIPLTGTLPTFSNAPNERLSEFILSIENAMVQYRVSQDNWLNYLIALMGHPKRLPFAVVLSNLLLHAKTQLKL